MDDLWKRNLTKEGSNIIRSILRSHIKVIQGIFKDIFYEHF